MQGPKSRRGFEREGFRQTMRRPGFELLGWKFGNASGLRSSLRVMAHYRCINDKADLDPARSSTFVTKLRVRMHTSWYIMCRAILDTPQRAAVASSSTECPSRAPARVSQPRHPLALRPQTRPRGVQVHCGASRRSAAARRSAHRPTAEQLRRSCPAPHPSAHRPTMAISIGHTSRESSSWCEGRGRGVRRAYVYVKEGGRKV